MPEHVHLLVSEPEESSLSAALQVLKQEVARILLRTPKKSVPGQLLLGFAGLKKERHLWQRRFYDFKVWSESKFKKIELEARESSEKRIGASPEGLAVEQLVTLCPRENGVLRIDRLAESGERNRLSKKRQNPHP